MVKYTATSGIYVILNTKNGKVYIGSAHDFRKRWNKHKRDLINQCHHNAHLQRAWNKYGEKAFKFKKLEYCATDQLELREQHYVNIYTAKGSCYNIASDVKSPMRGRVHNEETRLKISKAHQGRVFSEEHRRKLSDIASNRSPETLQKMSDLAKNRTEEHRAKLNEAHRNISEETRLKMSESAKAKVFSDEHRRKIGDASRGHVVSEETRHKISEAVKRTKRRKNQQID